MRHIRKTSFCPATQGRTFADMDTTHSATAAEQQLSFTIRPSGDDNMAAIAAIYGHHVIHGTGSFETEPPGVDEMRHRRAAIVERGLPYLVAADSDGAVLGYAYAGAYRPRIAYANTVENSVYVRHDCMGRGIGRSLSDRQLLRAQRATREEKAAEYLRLRAVAASKGFKPGFVAHQYRETFGVWPKFSDEDLAGVEPATRPFFPLPARSAQP